MNVVLCNIDPSVTNIIISQLVNFKLNVDLVEEEDIIEILTKKQIDCLFYDIDIFETDVVKILKEIKEHPQLKNLKIIVLTANKDKKLINDLFSLQIAGIVSKNTDYHNFIKSLKKTIVFLESEVKVRENKWIALPPEDNVHILLTINNDLKLRMKVVEISAAGIKVEDKDRKISALLKSDAIFKNTVLFINKKIYYTDVKITGVKKGLRTMLFLSKKDVFLLEISSYIYNLSIQ